MHGFSRRLNWTYSLECGSIIGYALSRVYTPCQNFAYTPGKLTIAKFGIYPTDPASYITERVCTESEVQARHQLEHRVCKTTPTTMISLRQIPQIPPLFLTDGTAKSVLGELLSARGISHYRVHSRDAIAC